MTNYDFMNLSPIEFEMLSRDLLQKEIGVTLENFKSGKDNGIDLRFCESFDNAIIVQSKRYKDDFFSLYNNLKKEIAKVKIIKPLRYIITTSVSLNPAEKDKIIDLFKPYIKRKSDIYGKEDLNNLLSKYQDIETSYYKLWLSSTNILQRIINNGIAIQSEFTLDEIKRNICLYVSNASLAEAENLLKKHHVVIISGIPGVGKTTLANILSYRLISENSNLEFIALRQNISEGFELYITGKKQLFFFDDFLGSNFLSHNLNRGEDKSIVQFIASISKSKDKYLICTTREYILQQARQDYEKLNKDQQIDLVKYALDLSDYTLLVRAKILYNHLFFSQLPRKYLIEVLKNKNYYKIIHHENFNPRIIELVTDYRFYNLTKPQKFIYKILEYLENPTEIWADAYERQISKLSQIILLILVTTQTPITYEDLFNVTKQYFAQHNIYFRLNFDESEFRRALDELENTFISTKNVKISNSKESIIIDFSNPSIEDFLYNYLLKNSLYLKQILISSIYFNQLTNAIDIFDDKRFKYKLDSELTRIITERIIATFDMAKFSSLRPVIYPDELYKKSFMNLIVKISTIVQVLNKLNSEELKDFIIKRFEKIPYDSIMDTGLWIYLSILENIFDFINIDAIRLLSVIGEQVQSCYDVTELMSFKKFYPNEYNVITSEKRFKRKIIKMVKKEIYDDDIEYQDPEQLDSLYNQVKKIEREYSLNLKSEIAYLLEEIRKNEKSEEEEEDRKQDSDQNKETNEKEEEYSKNEDISLIDDMFASLNIT
jgi:DNA polymerase III delta prime subunit